MLQNNNYKSLTMLLLLAT